MKTQDQKDDFFAYYAIVQKQSEKCTNPIFDKEKFETVKLYMKISK